MHGYEHLPKKLPAAERQRRISEGLRLAWANKKAQTMKLETLKQAARANDACSESATIRNEPVGMGLRAACREAGVSREDVMYVAEQRALMYVTRSLGLPLPKAGEPFVIQHDPIAMRMVVLCMSSVLDGILIGLRATKLEAAEEYKRNRRD